MCGGLQRSRIGHGRVVPHRARVGRVLLGQTARHGHARVHQARLDALMVMWGLGLAREVEQVDAHEDDEEAADERDGVDAASGVEPLEQDGRRNDGSCGEEDVVDGVDDIGREGVKSTVEEVLRRVRLSLYRDLTRFTICMRMHPTTHTPNT